MPALPSLGLGIIHCSATAVPPLVRAEGTRELVGDILITCRNAAPVAATPGQDYFEADISLSLNADFGNRVDYGEAGVTDAVLVVNENHCFFPAADRAFGQCDSRTATVQDPMLATWSGPGSRSLQWKGIAFPIPGAPIGAEAGGAGPVPDCTGRVAVAGGCHPRTTTLRLTHVRANASQLGVAGSGDAGAVPIRAAVSIAAPNASIVFPDSVLDVAEAAPGLRVAARPVNSSHLCGRGEADAEIVVSEGFASAFKRPGRVDFTPGDPGWRDDYYPYRDFLTNPAFGVPGTRLRIALSGLPRNLAVSVPASVSCSANAGRDGRGLRLRLVEGADGNGAGGRVADPASATYQSLGVSSAGGAAAVYEVTDSDPLAQEECRLPFRLARSAPIEEARIQVSADLAPLQVGAEPASRARFVVARGPQRAEIPLRDCRTTLFFPFITNRSNFETALVITNASMDPIGTRHQAGRCALRYVGSGTGGAGQAGPSVQTTVPLAAGDQLRFNLSDGNPEQGVAAVTNFQGYLLATCDFQHAHGFAFVTGLFNGTDIHSQGYLAERVRSAEADSRTLP